MPALQSFNALKELALAEKPLLAIVIGSGLGTATSGMQALHSVPFSQIPDMSAPPVPGHEGQLALGDWGGKRVLVFEGRLHFYEGHSWDVVTLPIRVAQSLGARMILSTNAAGGIHPRLCPGSFMAIRDHLDWTRPRRAGSGRSPSDRSLRHSEPPFEARSPDPPIVAQSPATPVVARSPDHAICPSPYSDRLLDLLQQAAAKLEIDSFPGIYAAVTGPNYETPAEIRALRHCGADAVGMSTAREIQVAHDLGMECAAISCITNRAAGLDDGAAISHDEVIQTAMASSRQLARLIESFIVKIA